MLNERNITVCAERFGATEGELKCASKKQTKAMAALRKVGKRTSVYTAV